MKIQKKCKQSANCIGWTFKTSMCYHQWVTPYTMEGTSYGFAGCAFKESVSSKYTIHIPFITKTRMTTSISSDQLFCLLQPDQRTKYLQNRCSYTREMCTQKMRALSYIGAEKITFPPKPDRQTYRQTYIHTDGRTLAFIEQLRY